MILTHYFHHTAVKLRIIPITPEVEDKVAPQQGKESSLMHLWLSLPSEGQEVPTENKILIMFKKLNIRFLLTAGLQSQESLNMQLMWLMNINTPVPWQLIQVSNIRIERILVCDPSSWTIIVYSLLCLQNTNNWLLLYSAPSNNNYLASEGHYNSTLQ